MADVAADINEDRAIISGNEASVVFVDVEPTGTVEHEAAEQVLEGFGFGRVVGEVGEKATFVGPLLCGKEASCFGVGGLHVVLRSQVDG